MADHAAGGGVEGGMARLHALRVLAVVAAAGGWAWLCWLRAVQGGLVPAATALFTSSDATTASRLLLIGGFALGLLGITLGGLAVGYSGKWTGRTRLDPLSLLAALGGFVLCAIYLFWLPIAITQGG